MDKVTSLKRATQRSFGYQWTRFADMVEANREHFLTYIHPIEPPFFKDKLGLDAACGFGRHLYYAREFGARMVGVDFSAAIQAARAILGGRDGTSLVQGDLYHLPFKPNTFDFIYSLGALHHLPDPEEGFRRLLPCLKPGGPIFIWVYSKQRRVVIRLLEWVRLVTTRLPLGVLKHLCWILAVVDYLGFVLPYRLLARWLGRANLADWIPPRIRLYAKFPFRVGYADWFDRLAAPIRFYYDERDLREWAARAGLVRAEVSATGAYGIRLLAFKPDRRGPAETERPVCPPVQ
jgi:SAM-dependent methyltransferase